MNISLHRPLPCITSWFKIKSNFIGGNQMDKAILEKMEGWDEAARKNAMSAIGDWGARTIDDFFDIAGPKAEL
jgi:hypothetical protein